MKKTFRLIEVYLAGLNILIPTAGKWMGQERTPTQALTALHN
jgi:hypothetical protein